MGVPDEEILGLFFPDGKALLRSRYAQSEGVQLSDIDLPNLIRPHNLQISKQIRIDIFLEYTLRESNQPIGVATYQIQSTLPNSWQAYLPTPEQLVKHTQLIKSLSTDQDSLSDTP